MEGDMSKTNLGHAQKKSSSCRASNFTYTFTFLSSSTLHAFLMADSSLIEIFDFGPSEKGEQLLD